MGRPNVTSADVAAAAGVSRATVSYVLNGVDARVFLGSRASKIVRHSPVPVVVVPREAID